VTKTTIIRENDITCRQTTASVQPMMLHHKVFGQGPPVILLHGLLGMLDNWQNFGKRLAHNYTVYLVDQRNHGNSPHQEQMNYQLMAEDLQIFIESQGVDRIRVIGHSMGGKVAMQMALSYPDLVSHLIVLDITPKRYTSGHDQIFTALRSLSPENYTTRSEIQRDLNGKLKDPTMASFLSKNIRRDPNGRFHWKMNLEGIFDSMSAILEAPKMVEGPYFGPTVFFKGANSDYVLPGDQIEISRMFPHATIEVISNAGHWLHVDASDLLHQKIEHFLM